MLHVFPLSNFRHFERMFANRRYSEPNCELQFTILILFYYHTTNSQREHVYLLLHQHAFILKELKIMSSEEEQ
jgi:hypothetical protein